MLVERIRSGCRPENLRPLLREARIACAGTAHVPLPRPSSPASCCLALLISSPSCPTTHPAPPCSQVATRLEAALKASSKAAEAAKVLPPGAAQVQPLMEVVFVLADIRGKLQPVAAAGEAAAIFQRPR